MPQIVLDDPPESLAAATLIYLKQLGHRYAVDPHTCQVGIADGGIGEIDIDEGGVGQVRVVEARTLQVNICNTDYANRRPPI